MLKATLDISHFRKSKLAFPLEYPELSQEDKFKTFMKAAWVKEEGFENLVALLGLARKTSTSEDYLQQMQKLLFEYGELKIVSEEEAFQSDADQSKNAVLDTQMVALVWHRDTYVLVRLGKLKTVLTLNPKAELLILQDRLLLGKNCKNYEHIDDSILDARVDVLNRFLIGRTGTRARQSLENLEMLYELALRGQKGATDEILASKEVVNVWKKRNLKAEHY
eukprot:Filipodium_phascolosomae@DN5935_c0_g1_i1.p1